MADMNDTPADTYGPTLVHTWHRAWRDPARRDAPALASESGTLSYAQLFDRVGRVAAGLRARGVGRGARVAIAMERSPAQVAILLGAMAAGACPCPLEAGLSAAETARRMAVGGMGWAIHDEAGAAGLAGSDLPAAQVLPAEALTADALTADAPAGADSGWAGDLQPGDAGLLLFTSGSTALPKGVLLSHAALLSNTRGVVAHTGLGAGDVLLHVMPLYHTNGLNNQLFAPLCAGAAVALAGRFRAQDMPGLMERFRPTIVTGVPTMYARMLEHAFPPAALARLRFARCGSAPITVELHERIEAHLGRPLVVSYGLSEAACTSTMNPPERRRIGSVGTVLAGQLVLLRSADGSLYGPPAVAAQAAAQAGPSLAQAQAGTTQAGAATGQVPHPAGQPFARSAAPGQEGEICIAGPSLMQGYLGTDSSGLETLDPAAAAAAGIAAPPGGLRLLRTGDLGRFDEDGYLYITGRLKDVIIRGGENLSPALIEEAVAACPGVAACCVVGAPDADLGEVPVAFVVADAAAGLLDADAVQQAVAQRLGRIYRPARVLQVDQLPENSVGKIDRKALAAQLRAPQANPA